MRILHLAYEDPKQPGSGGGAVRTREINRRLSGRHEITALVAGYPGAVSRIEDGIRWVPVGSRTGTKADRLAYFAVLGPEIARRRYDLLVEDFGAPFSVGFAPLFTRKPVVACVQWLGGAHMRQKYRLPFDRVERFGLRYYHDFVAVSGWLADEIRARRPGAAIETIPNGIEELAFDAESTERTCLVFVGRLDVYHKGLDLLVEAMARLETLLGGRTPPLKIIGDGPDRRAVETLVAQSGARHLVEFLGRVEGAEKYRLMANAHAVLMPSRFETFGMVAVESQAVGTPVVAFDIGPLAEVAGGGGARLVPPFDVETFAHEVANLVGNPAFVEELRQSGRCWARRYDWDRLATLQEEHYVRVLARAAAPKRRDR